MNRLHPYSNVNRLVISSPKPLGCDKSDFSALVLNGSSQSPSVGNAAGFLSSLLYKMDISKGVQSFMALPSVVVRALHQLEAIFKGELSQSK